MHAQKMALLCDWGFRKIGLLEVTKIRKKSCGSNNPPTLRRRKKVLPALGTPLILGECGCIIYNRRFCLNKKWRT